MACAIDHEFEPRRFLLFCLKSEPCGSMLATVPQIVPMNIDQKN